jgi:hypothetical protein
MSPEQVQPLRFSEGMKGAAGGFNVEGAFAGERPERHQPAASWGRNIPYTKHDKAGQPLYRVTNVTGSAPFPPRLAT